MPDPTNPDVLAKARDLIRAGKVDDADKLLKAESDRAAGVAAEASSDKPLPPPRQPQLIVFDLVRAFAQLLGNHPTVAHLVDELDRALAPKK